MKKALNMYLKRNVIRAIAACFVLIPIRSRRFLVAWS